MLIIKFNTGGEFLGILARVLIYGDLHLSSKAYGAHINYQTESLDILKKVADKVEELNPTFVVGLGDFTFYRFHTLEYRMAVENELTRIRNITNGNHFQLKGNHDSASYGMTEFDYYIKNGYMRPAANVSIGNVNINMVNYGETLDTDVNIGEIDKSINIILAHDYLSFSDAKLPNYGDPIMLDNFEKWFGVDYIICGHIHKHELFEGLMLKEVNGQSIGHRVLVNYPGAMTRPAFREGHMDLEGHMVMLDINDDGTIKYEDVIVPLLPLDQSFNLDAKAAEKEAKAEKKRKLDILDIVKNLDEKERNVGNPEEIILSMNVDYKYKEKAIELLKLGKD